MPLTDKTAKQKILEEKLKNPKTDLKFLNESLKWACFEGDSYSVDLLLKSDANANYTDEFGTTVLHFAIKSGQEDVVIILLNHGANYLEWKIDGINMMQWCVRHSLIKVLDFLIKKFDMNIGRFDDMGCTGLHTACMYGQAMVAEYILDNNLLSVDVRDDNGWTPLHYACSEAGSNFRNMIQILFRFQADPTLLTLNNKTSLDLAYESGRAQQLIDVLTVQKTLQILISVDSVMVDKGRRTDREGRYSEDEGSETQFLYNKALFHLSKKTIEQQTVLKLSIWRKILLNDDIERLKEYRDSGIWYKSEETISFEGSQDLSKEHFLEIFNSCYENGVGIYSYFNDNFKTDIDKLDLCNVLTSTTGLTTFSFLEADDCVVFGGFHESILFLAFISGRFRVVEMLLKMRQFDIIPCCLLICLIVKHIQEMNDFHPQIIDNLQALSNLSEAIAVDVLARVYFKDTSLDKQVTLQFIDLTLTPYGGKSLIDLADLASCSTFLSLPCCQLILDRRWYGNLKPLRSHLKWIIRLIPLTILVYNPYEEKSIPRISELKTSLECRSSNVEMTTRNRLRLNKKVSELNDYADNYRYPYSSSRIRLLYTIVSAPGTKFFYHSTAHVIFIVVMSYIMLFDYHNRFEVKEICCYLFVLGYGLEELCQCGFISARGWIVNYFGDKWNWLDLSALSMTAAGVSLKVIVIYLQPRVYDVRTSEDMLNHTDVLDQCFYYSKVVLLFGLMLFSFRMLFMMSSSTILGPKLMMIGDMLRKDFLPLLLIFLIFILAFGVLFQGVLYPNGWMITSPGKNLTNMKVRGNNFEMVGMLLMRAIYRIFEADIPDKEMDCSNKDYCPHELGGVIVRSFSWIIYIIIVYEILINLLIALFCNTVSRINGRSTEHWLAGRFKLVEEYKDKSICPPPLNMLEHTISLVLFIASKMQVLKKFKSTLSWIFKVEVPLKSEVNTVVKFIIIQSFTLKSFRYTLGTKGNECSMDRSIEDLEEFELRSIKEKLKKIEATFDRLILILREDCQSNIPKTFEPRRTFGRFCNFQNKTLRVSKRNKVAFSKDYDNEHFLSEQMDGTGGT